MNRIICLDAGYFCHKSIHAYAAALKMKHEGKIDIVMGSAYNYFNIVCASLKKIGITKDDTIIVAKDGRNSWRKAYMPSYKGNRKALRDKATLFDWTTEYNNVSKIEHELNRSTNWHFIGLNYYFNFADLLLTDEGRELCIQNYDIEYDTDYSIESDDIQAVCSKKYPNHEVILVTIDEDLDQLYYYPNTKIFNPNLCGFKKVKDKDDPDKRIIEKTKVKGYYKVVESPLEVLNKKITSGDASDNIFPETSKYHNSTPEIRRLIIDLINLPKFIEDPISEVLDEIKPKETKYDELPFPDSLGRKFDSIYDQTNIVSMEKSIKAHKLREEYKKQQTKIAYAKRKAKKAKEKKEALR